MSHYFINDTNLKSDKKEIYFDFNNIQFKFISDNGVFSKDEIDEGSKILLNAYLKEGKKGKLLDVGAGIGVLGIVICKVNDVDVDMVEINSRSVELCKENISINKLERCFIYESDVYSAVRNKYDVIISNPPIRAGKKVVFEILQKSFNYLNDEGELWVVIRKKQGADSAIKKMLDIYGNCNIMKRQSGFYAFRSIKRIK